MIKWCMCKDLSGVARDIKSTCLKCYGIDAYGLSKERPEKYRKEVIPHWAKGGKDENNNE